MIQKNILFTLLCLFFLTSAFGRGKEERRSFNLDSTYIKTYYNDLIVRVYSSNKNNFIQFNDLTESVNLKYRPNDYFNLGVGFNYKWFGINIGTKLPLLPSDDDKYGKTSNFGLQSYLYARKFTIDLLALKTRGYYLKTSDLKGILNIPQEGNYIRRDLSTANFGMNINYVLNNRRFSYKAAFKQNELQLKSAGSVIVGGGIYALKVASDLVFVPREIHVKYFSEWRELNQFKSHSLNANVGYAYSWVPIPNWIITGSYRLSLGLQRNVWYSDETENKRIKMSRSAVVRISAGHHFPAFYFGASFVRYQQNSKMELHSLNILNGTNFTEFTISKRIKL